MCGIVGVLTTEAGKYNNPLNNFFRQALYADTFRGNDSTGVAVMHTGKGATPEVYKKALAGPDFLQLKPSLELLDSLQGWNVMIGHNRAATKGGVHHHTSHPFTSNNITLVHNGTVSNHQSLTGGASFTVDSEAVTHAVSVDGIGPVVSHLTGAFALVYHDSNDGSVNIVRNDERPLYIAVCKESDSVLFASEQGMLLWLAHRNKLEIQDIFQPKPGVHYKYFIGDTKGWKTTPIITKHDLREAYTYKSGHVLMSEMGHKMKDVLFKPLTWSQTHEVSGVKRGTVTASIVGCDELHEATMRGVSKEQWRDMIGKVIMTDVNSASRIHRTINVFMANIDYTLFEEDHPRLRPVIVGKIVGYNGKGISLKRFNRLTKGGCAYCTTNLEENDAGSIKWIDHETPLCEWCADSQLVEMPH